MYKRNEQHSKANHKADTVVRMNSATEPQEKVNDNHKIDDAHSSDAAIKEPQALVPAQDETTPPLEATLGSDDVFTPMEKH